LHTQIEIVPVTIEKAIDEVAKLAEEIWRDHYTPIIGAAQVDYMLTRFQSADAVKKPIGGGFYMDDFIMEKEIAPAVS